MMRKMNKSTLDFILNNIKTNAQSSSYPIRKQQDLIIQPPVITPSHFNTDNLNNAETLHDETLAKIANHIAN